MTRHGSIIRLRPEKREEYLRLHADVWPAVYERLSRSNLRNFTIFLHDLPDGPHLFMYYEYVGSDHAADMKAVADDPTTQEWWKLTDPCQEPLPNRTEGEWWSAMREACHHDLSPESFGPG